MDLDGDHLDVEFADDLLVQFSAQACFITCFSRSDKRS